MSKLTIAKDRQGAAGGPGAARFGRRARIWVAAAAAVGLAGVAIGYLQLSGERGNAEMSPTAQAVSLEPGPRLLTLTGTGQVTTVSTDNPAGSRAVSALKCDRIYAAAGTGACLYADGVLGTVKLLILDQDLEQRQSIQVTGLPNRVRVSASGRMVAWTLFVDGDGYATLAFSTRTGIYDTRTGERLDTMETFSVTKDGRPYRAADMNYWGVTFAADDNTFYATMHAQGRRYLVEGDFSAKTIHTLREWVECPSLSPDGTRIAFKEAVNGNPKNGWRLSVLDLATMRVTPTAETRSVDDQPAWLDNSTLGYATRHSDGTPDLWTVRADGSGTPTLLLANASSPAALS
jgi:WD40-like Beta Propeller Repeat